MRKVITAFEGSIATEDEANKMIHMALPIGKHNILIARPRK